METWKKKLALLLSLAMLISVLPAYALGLEDAPGGEPSATSDEQVAETTGLETPSDSKMTSDQEDYASDSEEQDTDDPEAAPEQEEHSVDLEDQDSDHSAPVEPYAGAAERYGEAAYWEALMEKGLEAYREAKESYSNAGTAAASVDGSASLRAGGMLGNQYIEAFVDGDGQFTMGTREGNPNSETDDNQNLLYGHPDPRTSNTLVRINGTDYWFTDYVESVEMNGNVCTATATIDGIKIKQVLSLQSNPYTGVEELVSIRYQYINDSDSTKQIGIRIMLDTMLGSNDGSPFRVNGQDVVNEEEFVGDAVPQYWQSFYSLTDPRVVSTGFFYFDTAEKPDRVQFARWGGIVDSPWEYQISRSQPVTNDSAVAVYFNPRTLRAGGSGSVVTYYGISSFSDEHTDLREPLAVRVTAPFELFSAEGVGGYMNNPFNVSVYVDNISGRLLENVSAVLNISPEDSGRLGLTGDQSERIALGDIGVGAKQTLQWNLQAVPALEGETIPYTLTFYEDSQELKSMALDLKLNELSEEDMFCSVSFDLNGQPGIAPRTQKINIGELVKRPVDPVSDNEDYIFEGWYKDASGKLPWNFDTDRVSVNTRLYARWANVGLVITGAAGLDADDCYIVGEEDDSYYSKGFRTVLVSEDIDLANVALTFDVDPNVTVYANGNAETGVEQTSGVTTVDFSGSREKAVEYTVVSPNGRLQRAYWVTVAEKQDAPTLLVNAANSDLGMTRELFLPGPDYYHDIFIANTGAAPLDKLQVSLDAAHLTLKQNSRAILIEGENGLLPGFSDTEGAASGQNCAKIRLYPSGYGVIDGTLTISAENQTPFVIHLNGVAGGPIETLKMPDAVKYVPYNVDLDQLTDLSQIYDEVEYNVISMPSWLQFADEIFSGMPLKAGIETIQMEVTVRYRDNETTIPLTVQLTVNNNTGDNVEEEVDPGYEIIRRVPDMISETSEQIFSSKGPFREFIALYLDGRLLQRDVDYTARDGSTIITVYDKTFSSLGSGYHTLAATFNSSTGVKRVAQNFYIGAPAPSTDDSSTDPITDAGTGGSSYSGPSRPISKPLSGYSQGIDIPRFEHGSITFSPNTVRRGTTVTLTSKPDIGYMMDWISVQSGMGQDVELTKLSDTEYTFVMPENNVSVSAEFVKILSDLGLDDVYPENWFYESVKWALDKGITDGIDSDSFGPNIQCTRAQLVTFIWKAAGKPEPENASNPFGDVPADSYYDAAVRWALEKKVTNGVNTGVFSPDSKVSRAEVVTMLYNSVGKPSIEGQTHTFADVSKGTYYSVPVAWAAANKVTTGTSGTTFSPSELCTRAHIVTFLYRMYKDEEAQAVVDPEDTETAATE